jgi:hypothetical protein
MNHLYYRFIYLASETSFYVIKFFHFKSPNWLINVALIDVHGKERYLSCSNRDPG